MRIHKRMKIDQATKPGSTDEACSLKLQVSSKNRGRLTATNGHISVVVPVELDEGDTAGMILRETLQIARKHVPKDGATDDHVQLLCGETVHLPHADQTHGRPRHNGALFGHHTISIPKIKRDGCQVVRINVADLVDCAAGLGASVVDVRYIPDREEDGIRVDPVETMHPGAAAVIMPRAKEAEEAGTVEDGGDAELDATNRPPSVAEARAARKAGGKA